MISILQSYNHFPKYLPLCRKISLNREPLVNTDSIMTGHIIAVALNFAK